MVDKLGKSKQAGFSILELIIALSVASVLLLSIFGVIRQIQRAVRQINMTLEKGVLASTFADQVERDVLGMFSPDSVQQELKNKFGHNAQKKNIQNKDQLKKWEPLYRAQKSDKELLWSFITTGGLETVTAQGQILAQPLVRRVLYKLEPQQESKQLFRLLYGSAVDDLDFNKLASKPSEQLYELARNLTDVTLEQAVLEVTPQKSAGQENTPAQDKQQPPKSAVLQTWDEQEIREKYKTAIPALVKLSGKLSTSGGQQTPFVFEFAVPSYEIIVPTASPSDNTVKINQSNPQNNTQNTI